MDLGQRCQLDAFRGPNGVL